MRLRLADGRGAGGAGMAGVKRAGAAAAAAAGAKRARAGVGGTVQPAGGGAPRAVDARRWREVVRGGPAAAGRPVVYWCAREQRVADNWALLHAAEEARVRQAPLGVAFALAPRYLHCGPRHYGFLLRGLREMEPALKALGVPFFLLEGDPKATVPALLCDHDAQLVVADMCPLRTRTQWREAVARDLPTGCGFHLVDAHNVVPLWEASPKQEYAARTIRPKIHRLLPEFLRGFPRMLHAAHPWAGAPAPEISWDRLMEERVTGKGLEGPREVDWLVPGEAAALKALSGDKSSFLSMERVGQYQKRNDPNFPQALSNLSPYLHLGQLSPQRAALAALKFKKEHPQLKAAMDSFLEELVVRRELTDNFCFHNEHYDQVEGASEWAQKTLEDHAGDKREYVYGLEKLEAARTHDELWNAAQKELVLLGKMHGFMRMYWAKKILEWTASPQQALEIALLLNDKYSLDGNDPNGYVGCMWSICGIHDMGWTERPIFGKIRYMNYNGCKRKFNIQGYVSRIRKLPGAGPFATAAQTAAKARS